MATFSFSSIADNRLGVTVQILLVIFHVLFITNLALAEDSKVEPATLSVAAHGKIQLAPDTAIVNLAVETAGKTFELVSGENQTKMHRVMKKLMEMGIPKERIQTTSFDVSPRYAPIPRRRSNEYQEPKAPKIIGYTARNTINVEIHDLEKVGRVVDKALQAGANRFSGVQWILRDRHPVYLRALNIAAKNAKEKAQTLAKALGISLGRLQTVQEGGVHVRPPIRSYAKSSMMRAEAADASVPMSPGEIKVESQVTLLYEIGPH